MEITRMKCECGHDLSAHRQGFWAPCAIASCNCKDFVPDEHPEHWLTNKELDSLTQREEERKA